MTFGSGGRRSIQLSYERSAETRMSPHVKIIGPQWVTQVCASVGDGDRDAAAARPVLIA